ncbi:hypothetical protein BGX38DRAFT_1145391 [Terfezia claveryi]|nr:hypothetical protein BGX38DRAFT_1145391 [Terfezia claveryi]
MSISSQSPDVIAQLASEKRTWPGWSTIESEPAVFNELLKNIGVRDTQVEEVYSLDEDSLNAIKYRANNLVNCYRETNGYRPVYGLIFLFRWKSEVDPEEAEVSCPEGVWFANQVTDNLCASLAMLNIVMNCPDVDVGEHLRSFREFSRDLSPPLRGLALANFEYLRQCHNAFARKAEMMDSDIGLLEASKRRKSTAEEEEEESFHFIAYVPIGNSLWELDGLKRQPVKLGKGFHPMRFRIRDLTSTGECTCETWLSLATPKIQERILRYEQDEIRFTLLAIVKKPLTMLQSQLSTNANLVGLIERRLDSLDVNWKSAGVEIGDTEVDQVMVVDIESELEAARLVDRRAKLVQEQDTLRFKIREEEEKLETYTTYATRKQHDYSPFISKMLGFLADNQSLQQYLE